MKEITSFTGEYRWLSNFWVTPVVIPGSPEVWPSVEHAYQAAKTGDKEYQLKILNAATPAAAKKLGRYAPMIPIWDQIKQQVMNSLVLHKFMSSEALTKKLLDTGDAVLVEGNWWHDNYWGECSCPTHAGKGQNHLGLILMQTRDFLRVRTQ